MDRQNTRLRVLIVDDSPEDRMLYRRLLDRGEREFEVQEVESGTAAIERLESEEFDCVLLDYMLPDRTGLQILEEVVGDGATPSMAFVMLTGQGNEQIAVAAMKCGVQDYLIKGQITAESLERVIDGAVERVALRRELDQHRLELMRSNRELERFASVVAHDLKSPLATLYMMLQARRAEFEAQDEDTQKFIRGGLAACERMDTLITELLDFSRIGGRTRSVEDVPCGELLKEVLDDLRALIAANGATVEFDALPVVRADRLQLARLFQNLIANAIKYRRSDPPVIRIDCEDGKDAWTFRVSDNGEGIDPSAQQDVFDAFCRLRTHDDVPGSGLGLAICKRIVEQSGGTIGLTSKVGVGTTIWFEVPKPR